MPTITPIDAPLLSPPNGFSILSYNVLLPNSSDGWWVYKYYSSSIPEEHRAWEHRKELLNRTIEQTSPDIVAIQEASADSFETDFDFMNTLGYDHCLHSKFRFRSATFWKRERFEVVDVFNKDRTLVSRIRDKREGKELWVVNCHLSAGPAPAERLRQVHDGLDTVRKQINKGKNDVTTANVIVCGDFNSGSLTTYQSNTSVGQLLYKGEVSPNFIDGNYPTNKITSKSKKQPFGPMKDAYEEVYGENMTGGSMEIGDRPPTYLAKILEPLFYNEDRTVTKEFVEGIQKMFAIFKGEGDYIDREGVDKWLMTINRGIGRGSEYRAAIKLLEENPLPLLSFEDFLSIYQAELKEGKFWGVDHDMTICNCNINTPWNGPFEAIFDYIFYTPLTMNALSVLEPITEAQKDLVAKGDYPPNSWHPSDHLPIAATFEYIQ